MRPANPALVQHPDVPAIWVWDEQLLSDYDISLKRIVFMYETVIQLPVTIRKGNVIKELLEFTKEHGANRIVTTPSPSPLFAQYVNALEKRGVQIELLEEQPFVDYDGRIDLKRFSRYWRTVEQYAFK